MSLLLSYLETLDSYRTVKLFGNQTIAGEKIFTDSVIFQGAVTFSGTPTLINTVDLEVEDNNIIINAGEVGAGVTAGYAGLQVDRGSLAAYQFQFRESDDTFCVGQIGSLQAVATRQDSPSSAGLAYWNSVSTRFDTTGYLTWATATNELTVAGVSNSVIVDGTNGSLELCNTSGLAQIDFKNLAIDDADARIKFNSNGLDFYVGGNGALSLALGINSSGVITTGTWNATVLGIGYGGTNATSQAANGLNYFDGTKITSSSNATLSFIAGDVDLLITHPSVTGTVYEIVVTSSSCQYVMAYNTASTFQGICGTGATENYWTLSTAGLGLYVSASSLWFGSTSNNDLSFYRNNTERLRLTTTGIYVPDVAYLSAASPTINTMVSGTSLIQSSVRLISAYSGAASANSSYFLGSGNDGGLLQLFGAGGTIASPTALTTDSRMGGLFGRGYAATGYSNAVTAVTFHAESTFTDTSTPTYIAFATTASGATTRTEAMRITSAGNLLLGTTSTSARITLGGSPVMQTLIRNDAVLTASGTNANQYGFINYNNMTFISGSSNYATGHYADLKVNVPGGATVINATSIIAVAPTNLGAGSVTHAKAFQANAPSVGASSNIAAYLENVSIGSGFTNTTPPTNGALIQGNVAIATTDSSRRLVVAGVGATRDPLLYLRQTNDYGYSFNLDSSSSGRLSVVGVNAGAETVPIQSLDRTTAAMGMGAAPTTTRGYATRLDIYNGGLGPSIKVQDSAGSGRGHIQFGSHATVTNNALIGDEGNGQFYVWNGTFGSTSEMLIVAPSATYVGPVSGSNFLQIRGNDSAAGSSLQILNSSKTGANCPNWVMYNMGTSYGNGLQFWRYPASGGAYNTFNLKDTGDAYFNEGGVSVIRTKPIQFDGNPTSLDMSIHMPNAYPYGLRISGANDAGNPRTTQFGYYLSGTWQSKAEINNYTGDISTTNTSTLNAHIATGAGGAYLQLGNSNSGGYSTQLIHSGIHSILQNGAGGSLYFRTYTANYAAIVGEMILDSSGNFVVGPTSALATNATSGFIYIRTCAGTPTGAPTAFTGHVAMLYDTTNNKLYCYNGAWKSVTLT